MDEKPPRPIPTCDCANDVARSFRDLPPAHYIIKIESLSNLKQKLSETGAKSYESQTFEACGYKWKLSLYPSGDKARKGKGYISMFLVIQDTGALPLGWEVYVNFKLFVFDQIRGKYLTVQDALGKVRRFDEMKKEWGFAQLLPHDVFHDSSNGYLIDERCVFGAEVLVINRTGKGECWTCSILKDDDDCRYTWKISPFSALVDDVHYSDVFTLANFKWKLQLFPKGHSSGEGNSLSLFLMLVDMKTSNNIDVEYKLSIQNQSGGKDEEYTVHHQFTSSKETWGFSKFLSLSDLKDSSKGFLVNDRLIIVVGITKISALQSFS